MKGKLQISVVGEPPLLIGESREDYERLCTAIESELRPRGAIEKIYVDDITYLTWDILRLRRSAVAIINASFLPALESVLQLLEVEEYKQISIEWFSDRDTRKNLSAKLKHIGLDESAIEAEAIRQSSADLEMLERMISSIEWRRNKALACLADYRGHLGTELRKGLERAVDNRKVLRLENSRPNKPSAA